MEVFKFNMKKITSVLLAIVLCLSLTAPAFAASFDDIKDEDVLYGAETLRMLGVINGVGGSKFSPDTSLTRAQFCKMAVIISGQGSLADSYMGRTIFPDVKANHWARGYINLMASSASPLLRGFSDGTFRPDVELTYAQAVTILMRLLGYTDADAGMLWPKGYIDLAGRVGLTKGLETHKVEGPVTRGDTVKLFINLLGTQTKADAAYINSLGTQTAGVIVFKYENELLYTSKGNYSVNGTFPDIFTGKTGTLLTDSKNKVISFLVDKDASTVSAVLSQIQADSVITDKNVKYKIESTTRLYVNGTEQTYSSYWININKGSGAVLYFDKDLKLSLISVSTAQAGSVAVVKSGDFRSAAYTLTKGASGYSVIRNGSAASLNDAKLYDVAVYDAQARVLTLTDKKLTGCYENASPNTVSPENISVLGHSFKVLESARNDLSAFNVGHEITLLLADDNSVAGVLPASALSVEMVGILKTAGSTVKVELLNIMESGTTNGLEVTGKTTYAPTSYTGELVLLRSYTQSGTVMLSVSLLSGNITCSLYVNERRLGVTKVSSSVKVYERVSGGDLKPIDYEDITQSVVSSSKILIAHADGNNEVDVLVLNDVTGDLYEYGFITSYDQSSGALKLLSGGKETTYYTNYTVTQGTAAGVAVYNSTNEYRDKDLVRIVELTKVTGISRSAFTMNDEGKTTAVELPAMVLPVSDKVLCYNIKTGVWFKDLDEARAFADRLTVYYDKLPENGGKVRLVVVE
jgi:hypothetical protein